MHLEVERFDILEWSEVIEEVQEQLQNYLNEGGVIIEIASNDKIPVSVYAESTPNPAVMKFVANKPLVSQSMEFKTIDEAKNAPLAQKLFHFLHLTTSSQLMDLLSDALEPQQSLQVR